MWLFTRCAKLLWEADGVEHGPRRLAYYACYGHGVPLVTGLRVDLVNKPHTMTTHASCSKGGSAHKSEHYSRSLAAPSLSSARAFTRRDLQAYTARGPGRSTPCYSVDIRSVREPAGALCRGSRVGTTRGVRCETGSQRTDALDPEDREMGQSPIFECHPRESQRKAKKEAPYMCI